MTQEKSFIEFKINVTIEPDVNGYHAYCPALKGLHTCGDTKEEALRNAGDAAVAYLQSLIKHGDPIPVGVSISSNIERPPNLLERNESQHTEDLTVACAI